MRVLFTAHMILWTSSPVTGDAATRTPVRTSRLAGLWAQPSLCSTTAGTWLAAAASDVCAPGDPSSGRVVLLLDDDYSEYNPDPLPGPLACIDGAARPRAGGWTWPHGAAGGCWSRASSSTDHGLLHGQHGAAPAPHGGPPPGGLTATRGARGLSSPGRLQPGPHRCLRNQTSVQDSFAS